MKTPLLRRIKPHEVKQLNRTTLDSVIQSQAAAIVEDVRQRGLKAMVEHAVELGDLRTGEAWMRTPAEMKAALDSLPSKQRGLLERTADRIRRFAQAQRACLQELNLEILGGHAGHTIRPVRSAGCYAPGGRFPLPSSVLMTAITARVAGVETVWVASPRPVQVTLAACALAEVTGLLAVGGAQAIAALAYGAGPLPACDVVVGPGNTWVTAAKHLVSTRVAIDMLAGPSELLVLADSSADPSLIAADLLAQAEHDPKALPMLVALDAELIFQVEEQLEQQLGSLPGEQIARSALSQGFCVLCPDLNTALSICDELAPEHLELFLHEPEQAASRLQNYGALFIGSLSAEVLGDYGAGPNHVLPTGGSARNTGGLSVLHFLTVRTWLRIDQPAESAELTQDAAALARLEGLEAHARAAELRQRKT